MQTLRFVGAHKKQLDDFFESKKSVFLNDCAKKNDLHTKHRNPHCACTPRIFSTGRKAIFSR